ncbi:cupin domain-containing protein [Limibaculum sp. M0105]|uniref:Cupin domain-containing protein n=1 Tax=Thermohalobaculum xanthum TaxID=2753746 RepID=A0A8J7M579_9RHOB|nr:cupin domain-containing protein [Thermohalobaculum xanthum]MBK0398433.1 cupin domain-containing protein [Thermohalobaculum xanthum]
MRINDDFSRRAAMHPASNPWVPSPAAGVERRMLDRIGDEVARATTIVRFAPGSAFAAHTHGGGEEFLVLEGVFQDESGDFPAGTYVRNPPTSRHTPASAPGCTIFVKLWQMSPDDRAEVRVPPAERKFSPAEGRPGIEVAPLHSDAREDVRLERWAPGAKVTQVLPGGAEILVLEGDFAESAEQFEPQAWLRLPKGARLEAQAGPQGALVWVKTGHLSEEPRPPAA